MGNVIRKKAIDNTIENMYELAESNVILKPFIELEESEQYEVFNYINKAFANIIKYNVENALPITLPYIGKLKIKELNKHALRIKEEVAKEFGYESFKDVPHKDFDNVKKVIQQRVIKVNKELIENKKRSKVINKHTNISTLFAKGLK